MMYSRQGSVTASVAYLTFKKVGTKKEEGSFICGLCNDSLSSLKNTESMSGRNVNYLDRMWKGTAMAWLD
jgi:hypothetical protein